MPSRDIDANWIATALDAAVDAAGGAPVTPAEAEALARTVRRLLGALDTLGAQRRFEDEPAGFAAALLRHRQPEAP